MVAMGLAFCCLFIPVRTIISMMVDTDAALECETKYEEVVANFPTDYDKENPFTAKEGTKRLIGFQLEKAKKEGRTGQAEMLEK